MVGVEEEEEEGWGGGGSLDQFAVESAVSLTSRGDLLFLLWCRGSRRATKKKEKEKKKGGNKHWGAQTQDWVDLLESKFWHS